MNKSAQLDGILDNIRHRASSVGDSAKNFFGRVGQNEDLRNTLIRGLAGAAIGGTVTGGLAALTPRDEDDRRSIVSPALMGALLGGGAAAALPLGIKLLNSPSKLEPKKPLISRGLDAATRGAVNNAGVLIGGAAGAHYGQDAYRLLRHGLTSNEVAGASLKTVSGKHNPLIRRLYKIIADKEFWRAPRHADTLVRFTGSQLNPSTSKDLIAKGLTRTKGIRGGRLGLFAPIALAGLGYIAHKAVKGDY